MLFTLVTTFKEPILALLYLSYTSNEQNGRKDEIQLHIQERLIFYKHNIHTDGITNKEYTNLFQKLKLYSYCSMKKQYVEGVQNSERLISLSLFKRAICLYLLGLNQRQYLLWSKTRSEKDKKKS